MNVLQIAARISATCVESKTRHKDPGNKFDLSEFKSLPGREGSFSPLLKYANDRLKFIGGGSARAVFILSSSKVLKIAYGLHLEPGLSQNKAEVDFYTNPKTKQVCAKIFDFDPNYEWLISELVKPVNESEFKKLTGVNPWDFRDFGKSLGDGLSPEEVYEQYLDDNEMQNIKSIPKKMFDKWIYVLENILDQGVLIGDLTKPDSWGVTSSGNLVILDYGINKEVKRKHYRSDF